MKLLAALIAILPSLVLGQAPPPTSVTENVRDQKLYEAIAALDIGKIRKLLASGSNPNGTYSNKWPMIFAALEKSDDPDGVAILKVLIESGANVNSVHIGDGWTPIHMACATRIGRIEAVELLLDRGARLDSSMPGVGAPLNIAVQWGRLDFVKLLVKRGADLESKSTRDPKVRAASSSEMKDQLGDEPAMQGEKFIADYFEPGYDGSGKTPLLCCAASAAMPKDAVEVAKFLLDQGARIDATDSIGRTALHDAVQAFNSQLVEFLLSRGAEVDPATKNGLTPLHLAVRPTMYGSIDIRSVEVLLRNGADPNKTDSMDHTALALLKERARVTLGRYEFTEGMPEKDRMQMMGLIKRQVAEVEALLKSYGGKEVAQPEPTVIVLPILFPLAIIAIVAVIVWVIKRAR